MEIKQTLRNARKSRGLTLAQVAKDTGIALTTVNAWERGASYPRGKHRDTIAEYYKLPPESLDYALYNQDSGARELNVAHAAQAAAMTDYETKPIMLHRSYWELAGKVMKKGGDVDFNEMFTRLIKAAG